jgi:hypothetical protein
MESFIEPGQTCHPLRRRLCAALLSGPAGSAVMASVCHSLVARVGGNPRLALPRTAMCHAGRAICVRADRAFRQNPPRERGGDFRNLAASPMVHQNPPRERGGPAFARGLGRDDLEAILSPGQSGRLLDVLARRTLLAVGGWPCGRSSSQNMGGASASGDGAERR